MALIRHVQLSKSIVRGTLPAGRICAIGVSPPVAYGQAVIFLETPAFTRQIKESVDDDQHRQLQLRSIARPDAGDLMGGRGA